MNKGYSNFNKFKQDPAKKIAEGTVHIQSQANIHIKKHPFSDAKYSPIKVPKNAIIKKQSKNLYDQIKYIWRRGKFRYESRWHTKTPNASGNKQSWVVIRTAKGKGFGYDATNKTIEVLVGKRWIPWSKWQGAIQAKKSGTASKRQINMLNKGHFTIKRGK